MKTIVSLAFFTIVCGAATARDPVADLAAINRRYSEMKAVSLKIKYSLYANWFTTATLQVETSEILRDGHIQYVKIGSLEAVQRNEYQVVVDHDEKTIVILRSAINPEIIKPEEIIALIGESAGYCSITYGESGDQVSMIVGMPEGRSEYSKITIRFDQHTFLIDNITLFFRVEQDLVEDEEDVKDKPRLEVTFLSVTPNPEILPGEISYSRYLIKNSGRFEPKPAYDGYAITDQFN